MSSKGRRATTVGLLVLAAGLSAQDASGPLPAYILPEAEAPEAVLAVELGSSDARVYVDGTWKLGLEAGVGLRFSENAPPALTSGVGALASGLVFRQEPALVLSALLLERFFLETELRGEGERASVFLPSELGYLKMGYRAAGDELLRSVVLGTKDVSIDPYPFLTVPSMGPNSLGAAAVVQGPRARQEILLRLDRLPSSSVHFLGTNRVTEERVPPSRYLRGRVFLLPDRDVRDLAVLVEDPSGEQVADDGRRYRPLEAAEGSVSASDGTIVLNTPPGGSLVVWYRDAAGAVVGDASLGKGFLPAQITTADGPSIDPDGPAESFHWGMTYLDVSMDKRQVPMDGRTYLLLGRPGEFSPFELACTYEAAPSVSASSTVILDVAARGSDTAVADAPQLVLLPSSQGTRFVATLGGDPRFDIRDRYPFADPGHLLYGPFSPPSPGYTETEIRVRVLDPVDYLSVPGPVVPGSVRVIRGGVDDPRVTVDYSSGRVDLAAPPAPGEEIEILYRATEGTADTDLVVAWGNRIALGEHARMELAGGLLWNTTAGAFTARAGEATGGVCATAGFSGEYTGPAGTEGISDPGLNLDYSAALGLTLSQPDTTGVRRLFGMEGSTRAITLSAESARPSAPPQQTGADQTNRGALVYRDYHRYGLLGAATLLDYNDTTYVQYPYAEGAVTGPYDVGTASHGSGKGLALQFALTTDRWWAGMQMSLSPGKGVADLSGTQTIVVSYRAEAASGSYAIWIEAGSLAEDLDGDRNLDHEQSAADHGFTFDDTAASISLRVGAGPRGRGNGVVDTEDLDGNGYLDPEEPAVRYTVGTVSTGEADWATRTYTLTPDDRRLLSRARSLRVVVVREGPEDVNGRIIVDRIELEGSTFWASPTGSGTVAAGEVGEEDLDSSLAPAATLEQAYPEVAERFHAGGAVQKTLEVTWSGLAPAGLLVRGFADAGSGGIAYRDLRAYLRVPTLPTEADVQLELVDGEGRGIHTRFQTMGVEAWSELSVDTQELVVTLGEAVLPGAVVTVDPGRHDLVELRLTVEGPADGVLYLDEVRLTRPAPGVGAAGQASVGLDLVGSLVTAGDVVLVSGLHASVRTTASTAAFTPLFGQPASQPAYRIDGQLGVDTVAGRLTVRMAVDADPAGPLLSGGHDLDLGFPSEGIVRVRYRDSFATRGALPEFTHDVTLGLIAGSFSTSAALGSAVSGALLTQKWRLGLGVSPRGLPKLNVGLEAAKRASGYDPGIAGYPGWWLQGYALALPWTSGADSGRSGQARARLWLEPAPVGVETRAETGFATTALPGAELSQTTTLAYSLGLPLRVRPGGGPELTFAVGYENTLSLTGKRPEGRKDLVEDAQVLAAVLAHHAWLLSAVPVLDVISPSALARNAEGLGTANDFPLTGAAWRPQVTLSLKRGVGSRVGDLFVPSYLDLAFGRRAELSGDLTQALTTMRAGVRFSALNLFGRKGSASLVSIYDTDELSATASATASVPLQPIATQPWELGLEVSHLGSFAADANVFALENKLHLDRGAQTRVSDGVEARYTWTHLRGIEPPALLRKLGLGPARDRKPGELVHTERLLVSMDAVVAGEGGLTVTVGHTTRLEYPDLGFASARVGLAVQMRREGVSDAWSVTVGGEAAIAVEIRF